MTALAPVRSYTLEPGLRPVGEGRGTEAAGDLEVQHGQQHPALQVHLLDEPVGLGDGVVQAGAREVVYARELEALGDRAGLVPVTAIVLEAIALRRLGEHEGLAAALTLAQSIAPSPVRDVDAFL